MRQVRECAKCGDEYTAYRGKPGLIIHCTECGREDEQGKTRTMGVMIYVHKTAGEIQILPEASAKAHLQAANRIGKRSNLGRARGTEVHGYESK
jgi:ribosomal protein S27E